MEDNFRKDISLDDVSRVANVSPYYFSKVFKDETGETFVEYLTKLRIAYAKKLLREKKKALNRFVWNRDTATRIISAAFSKNQWV